MDFYGSEEEEEYVVERIEKRRVLADGKVEYYLKWKNWSSQFNTWEPEEHLNCPNLIQQFLRRERDRELTIKAIEEDDENNNKQLQKAKPKKNWLKIPEISGFDKGLEAENILGATDCNGLTFLIKYKGVALTELVPSKIVRYRCPNLVINFFEKHITWHNVSGQKISSTVKTE